jgi:diguanylate cyclase (GGDEF)-like protein
MDYAKFERLTIAIGAVAIMATAAFSLYPTPDTVELVAQLLLLAVLVGAVRWGRRGGTFVAVVATVSYILMRLYLPLQINWVADVTIAPEFTRLLIFRSASYALVGIVGGEACSRIKYAFARAQDDLAIDPSSRVYTSDFITRMIRTAVASYRRYGSPFSVIVLEIDPSVTEGLRSGKANGVVRAMASHLRNELRLVDDVGRYHSGSFLVILPQTGRAEAETVAARLASGLRDSVGIADSAIRTQVFGSTDDIAEIEALATDVTGN